MSSKQKMLWICAVSCLLLFGLLIVAVKLIDVAPIGPNGSEIGLSTLNGAVHSLLGENLFLYEMTEMYGILAIMTAVGFAVLGLVQLIRRRSLKRVDRDIYLLAVFYAAVLACYVFFEIVVINYRPMILPGEALEASFPSSHTLLVVTFIGAAMHQFLMRVTNKPLKLMLFGIGALMIFLTVLGRLACGVHWFTDILGGLLLSATLLLAYLAAYEKLRAK